MNTPARAAHAAATQANLAAVRRAMADQGVDALIVPRADEYLGEYIPAHNERLRWLTGFTGSAGLAVVLQDRAAMFVDGRYTVQVRLQVSAEDFSYHGLPAELPVDWLRGQLDGGARVLLDPRLCSLEWFEASLERLAASGIEVVAESDNPIDRCWQDRPVERAAEALCLAETYTGETSLSKRERIGRAVGEADADVALVFAPDSVSWLLNVRGRDVPRLPVLLSWAMLERDGTLHLVVDERRVPAGFADHVGPGVHCVAPADGEALLAGYGGRRVLADPATANAWTQLALRDAGAELIAGEDPVQLPKACKNAIELAGAQAAHRRDAVAVVRFLAWLDREVGAGRLHDEAALADRLGALRSEGEDFQEPSFDTISAAAANGAMCHYNHLDNEPGTLQEGSLYLVDSGGQYLDGTTDITRTVAIGTPTDEMRELFTLVLKGHIALDEAHFPPGTTGTHLDVLARQFLWQSGRDYDHGTGHGVGAFLSVHEGPQRISKAWSTTALKPGMILSNEPGYYRDGAFGIRCENLVFVREVGGGGKGNGAGEGAEEQKAERPMLRFEHLTLVPFDRRLIAVEQLSPAEQAWIDAYHDRVAQVIGPLLNDAADQAWLNSATRPL